MELCKRKDTLTQIHYWRTKTGQEVDIIKKQENKIIPIEIKSGNQDKIPTNLKSFIKKYSPPQAYILNWSVIKDEKYNSTLVKYRPLWFLV